MKEIRNSISSLYTDRKKSAALLDVAAAICFTLLTLYFVFRAQYGIPTPEEGFYLSIPFRVALGDSLIVNEWQPSQLTAFVQYLPVKLFWEITGNSTGIILFSRFFYVAVHTAVTAIIYCMLRKRGAGALLYSLFFLTYVPLTILAVGYFSAYILLFTPVCVYLFLNEKTSVPGLVLCGALTALSVLTQPFTALLYAAYTFLVFLRCVFRKKQNRFFEKYGFILNGKSWGFLSVGIAVCASAFFAFILRGASLKDVIASLPYIFSDPEYDFSVSGGNILEPFPAVLFKVLSPAVCVILALVFGAAVIFGKKKRRLMFFASCAAFILAEAVFFFRITDLSVFVNLLFVFREFPLILFGIECYIMTEKKDPRKAAFLVTAIAGSTLVSIASNCAIGMGAVVSVLPAVLCMSDLNRELRAEKKRKKPLKTVFASVYCIAVCACFVFACETFYFFYTDKYSTLEADPAAEQTEAFGCSEELVFGPLKGVRTSPELKSTYEDMCADLDRIMKQADGEIYVMDCNSLCYLYVGRPYPTYSMWYRDAHLSRQETYLALHPEKQPAYIYIPYESSFSEGTDDEDETLAARLAFIDRHYAYSRTEGKAGILCRVDAVKEDTFSLPEKEA